MSKSPMQSIRNLRRILLAITGAGLLACSGCGRESFEVSGVGTRAGMLVIRGVTIVDPRDGTLLPDRRITLEDGLISDIAPDADSAGDASATVVDARGSFVIPGLLEMHAHPLDHADRDSQLALMLANGITGYRQMSGSDDLLKARRDGTLGTSRIAPGLLQMPGKVLSPFIAGSVEQARETVVQQKAAGADFIKVGLESPEVFFATLEQGRQSGIAVLGHVPGNVDVQAAAAAGFRSIEHLGPAPGVLLDCSREAARIRADVPGLPKALTGPLLRIPFADRLGDVVLRRLIINPARTPDPGKVDRLQRILDTYDDTTCRTSLGTYVDQRTWQVPTLVRLRSSQLAWLPGYRSNPALRYVNRDEVATWNSITDDYASGLSDADKAVIEAAYAKELALVGLMDRTGVRMLAGSDASGAGWLVPGFALHDEFDELAKAGLSPLRILQMATINGAEYLGRTANMGTVEAGKQADLLLLDGNPLDSVQNLHAIHAVVRAGVYYSRKDLDAILEHVHAKLNPDAP